MVWISLLLLSFTAWSKELPKFLTKHSLESIRFISADGRYAYIQKRQGVLGLASSFRSVDFISDTSQSDFIVRDSRFKRRLTIEIIPGTHHEFNLIKRHKIMVVDWGKTQTREIGLGRNARLHLDDEWVSYYDPIDRTIFLQNVLTQKKYQIKLSPKKNPFYFPEVEMITGETVVYTDVNDKGFSALIQFNLLTQKSNILYRSTQSGTRMELCQQKNYLGIGEFPYDDVSRSSKILHIKLTGSSNLAGFSTIYNSSDSDIGNMVCSDNSIYFIKTLTHNQKINFKETEAVKLDLKTSKVQTVSDLRAVNQLVSMDDRILIPFRGDFYVLEGTSNLTEDKLKSPVANPNEELPLDI